ncbi:MAG: 2-oxoisovalerate dehydrogenase E1 component [Planctomycetota bacterium]|jgi:2-oxoisovalerate dehydrogenase E1 component
MSTNRVAIVEASLDRYLEEARPAPRRLRPEEPLRAGSGLTARGAVQIFEDQVLSRALDVTARELKKSNRSFYTISSAGHEQNAVLGTLLRPTDPAFLHYRSGAFMTSRMRQVPGSTPLFDTLLSLCASKDDPTAQGRHKVWGSRAAWVPPQTSTIASHLPKAVGLAFSIGRARRMRIDTGLPLDAIVVCSFGDASTNHATAQSGIHGARYSARRDNPTPILFLCEDNGTGISVATPRHWIRDTYGNRPNLHYFEAEGQLDDIHRVCQEAVQTCRHERQPVFLRLATERLWGHAGSDVETTYHSLDEIEAVEARDPLLANARLLVERGAATPLGLQALIASIRERVCAAAEEASSRPRLDSLAEIMAPLAPHDEPRIRQAATAKLPQKTRTRAHGDALPEEAKSPTRRTLAAQLNAVLNEAMAARPQAFMFGEDVGKKGGVYGITRGLQERFGRARVFDTLLDETMILGVAQGGAHIGLLPIAEIQYLAYIHNALDQLRGEACSLSFFSNGQFTNPMVVRVASFAYQKGFGGHFHNDTSFGALRDIPGLAIVTPSRGDDAVRLMRGALAMAAECARVVCFLEPIALYHERDLHEPGDGGWLTDYPAPDGSVGSALLPGEVGLYEEAAEDLLIISYANGVPLSLRAMKTLREEHGVNARLLDLRWLNPLPMDAVREHARACGRVLVVDECRRTGGGIAAAVIADLAEGGFKGSLRSVCAADTYVPLGPSTSEVLVEKADIVAAAVEVTQ